MEIQLGGAVANPIDHADNVIFAHMTALMKPEQRVRGSEAALGHHAAGSARERAKNYRLDEFAHRIVLAQPKRRHHTFARKPDAWDFVFDSEVHQDIGEQWMYVEVQMAVDMIEIADQLEMALDLRAQFVGHRGADRAVEEISHPRTDRTLHELARRIHGSAEPRGSEHTASAADHRVQAHVERRIVAREFAGWQRSRLCNHQARTAQNPVAMRAHDPGVDLG